MFVSTNYRPIVEATDHGTWRRLLLVRFPYPFRNPHESLTGPDDRRGDPGLRQRVKDDPAVSAAVLAWMVEGARRWYEHADRGELPEPPARVVTDTRAWRSESDQVLAYLTDRLRFDPRRHVVATDLLRDLNGWLTVHGHRGWSERTLAFRLEGHDELTRCGVAKKRLRCSPQTAGGLSRRERMFLSGQVPAQYPADIGLRFAAATELGVGQEEPVFDDGGVQGVQAAFSA
jgi:putative DNA primase/helicase